MSVRNRVLLGAVTLAVVIGVAGVWTYRSNRPPALDDHRAGVVRLTPRLGIPPIPHQKLTLADGSSVLLSVFRITGDGGTGHADIGVHRLPGGTDAYVGLVEGQRRVVQGVQIELLHVWVMPDAGNSAADVRVTPASSH